MKRNWLIANLERSTIYTFINAAYSVDSDTFTEKSSVHDCPGVPRSFKYTFDGKNLTFNYIGDPADDPCTSRRGDFDNVTYTQSN